MDRVQVECNSESKSKSESKSESEFQSKSECKSKHESKPKCEPECESKSESESKSMTESESEHAKCTRLRPGPSVTAKACAAFSVFGPVVQFAFCRVMPFPCSDAEKCRIASERNELWRIVSERKVAMANRIAEK